MPEMSKAKQEKELKLLRRKCLFLWKARVKERAGKKCEICGKSGKEKRITGHHIESFSVNKALRYDERNGISCCVTCHKFGRFAMHKSFCATYNFMSQKRMGDFEYLLLHYQDKVELTKEYLLDKIKELEI